VTVAGADALRTGHTPTFLIIGTGDDQPAFDKLNNNLPVALRSGQIQIHDSRKVFSHHCTSMVDRCNRVSIPIAET